MRYVVDIDGNLCKTEGLSYESATPLWGNIAKVRAVKAAGHEVVLFTARGTVTGIDWRPVTERQMQMWNVPYDELLFGKPWADVYVDDKAVNVRDWHMPDAEGG